MKALILSDSHGNFSSIMEAIEAERNISLIIFAGDIQRDADDIMIMYPNIPIEYVLGNNDWSVRNVPFDRIFDFAGKRIFLTHGHKYYVKSGMHTIFQKAHEVGADICIFGHTHRVFHEEMDGIVMLNPGSASFSYIVLEVQDGKINAFVKSGR